VQPGEVTLAHGGVLFLDELPEFRRDVIETLRTTMECGSVSIARARCRVSMPANPLVVAAMNPCPCGFAGDPERLCACTPEQVARYRARVSGPLLDRFDMHVEVPRVRAKDLREADAGERSASIRERVAAARVNALPPQADLTTLHRATDLRGVQLLDRAVEKLGLTARGYVKALRVAHTIARLEGRDVVQQPHVAEAVQYRRLDRRTP
jgi:magnesium chelatase family protein